MPLEFDKMSPLLLFVNYNLLFAASCVKLNCVKWLVLHTLSSVRPIYTCYLRLVIKRKKAKQNELVSVKWQVSTLIRIVKHTICISCFASLVQKSYLAANIAGLNSHPDFFSQFTSFIEWVDIDASQKN